MSVPATTMQIREVYEKHPYPAANLTTVTKTRWRLAPMAWINALWKPGAKDQSMRKILVAGCGTGSEAFKFRRCFPKAKIVAVDFSPRSIAIARHLQKCARPKPKIRFVVADLASRNLSKITGNGFDFVSCHGVLSYVPQPVKVLTNLKRLLKTDGALYLGVNGTEHFSVRGRLFLPAFGFDLAEPHEGPYLRNVLKLWEAILNEPGGTSFAKFPIGYLAGDLFGPLIHNLSLRDWTRLASTAGLHFQSNCSSWRTLRSAMEKAQFRLIIPRSRSEVCQLLAIAAPERFHKLLFTRQAPTNPPWQNQEELRRWRPTLTNLYVVHLPRRTSSQQTLRSVTFKSVAMNTRLDWKMPEWEVEILRRSNGRQSLHEILGGIPHPVPSWLLREQLYVLHQLLVITLLPG